MDPKKLAIVEQILEHLTGHQAKGLKDLLDKSKMPKEMPHAESVEIDVLKPKEEAEEFKEPMDKKVDESIEDQIHPEMEKKPGEEMGKDDEMTSEELEELLKKLI